MKKQKTWWFKDIQEVHKILPTSLTFKRQQAYDSKPILQLPNKKIYAAMWKRERKLNYREQLILKINEWRKKKGGIFSVENLY